MLSEDDRASCAHGIARVLRVTGPQPRPDVIKMLRSLDLQARDAEDVLCYALDRRVLAADGAMVRAADA
jgi:hypothetical protein